MYFLLLQGGVFHCNLPICCAFHSVYPWSHTSKCKWRYHLLFETWVGTPEGSQGKRKLYQGFIKDWAPSKWPRCKDNFACLVWPSSGRLFSEKFSSNSSAPLWKPGAIFLKTLIKPLIYNLCLRLETLHVCLLVGFTVCCCFNHLVGRLSQNVS